jgi:hypothetical protein
VAYRLDLPASSRIHPVIHVSQLKKMLGPQTEVPFRILQHRLVRKGSSSVSQVLVHWSGTSEMLATWEDAEALRQHFPMAPGWGQAVLQEGGIVSGPTTSPLGSDAKTSKHSSQACIGPLRGLSTTHLRVVMLQGSCIRDAIRFCKR